MPSVYLLHYDRPMGRKRHYIGFCNDPHPARRIASHMAGRGSKDTKRALKLGIKITMALHWSGPEANEKFERFLKDGMDTAQWCPLCAKNLKPIPKLTDYSPEEAARRAQVVIARHTADGRNDKWREKKSVDDMILEAFGSDFKCL